MVSIRHYKIINFELSGPGFNNDQGHYLVKSPTNSDCDCYILLT
jgi:hypothetical protein